MKLKQLESLLSNLQQFDNPRLIHTHSYTLIELEQYPTGAHIASGMLYTVPPPSPLSSIYPLFLYVCVEMAENSYEDVSNKVVADFGCGCGTLGLAATLLDVEHVIGIKVDDESLEIASINSDDLEVKMGLIQCKIKNLNWLLSYLTFF
uniref:Methyltransferase small domain-containing protein n=1 Tax=Lactuca sativa TaxID=4236 RepID=A0A9R1UWB9_LACSA|nr:hypothetical protein LSAT_V11C800404180 [Lactuca sativa]